MDKDQGTRHPSYIRLSLDQVTGLGARNEIAVEADSCRRRTIDRLLNGQTKHLIRQGHQRTAVDHSTDVPVFQLDPQGETTTVATPIERTKARPEIAVEPRTEIIAIRSGRR